jgi:SAM-dependent methyltransferase
MKDSRERFAATAEDYQRYRPGYPPEALAWLQDVTGIDPPARVADVGCGTGIFTRGLAARGYQVVGIDPNQAMLDQARALGGDYRRGEAAATGLADASMDLVTAAQAFHWFALDPTLAEFDRVLASGGWAVALWNVRASSPFNDAYEALLQRCSSEYGPLSDLHDPRHKVPATAIPGAVSHELFWHDSLHGWDAVLGRVRSASYVVHGVADRPAFESELRGLYDRYAIDGDLTWHLRLVAVAWPRRD